MSEEAKRTDTERLDWLERSIQTALVTTCFDLDGGVHLTVEHVGGPDIVLREKNNLREAIDEAMRRERES